MGTSIELTIAGISLSYSKNHMGIDWGHLFQEGDLVHRPTTAIDYDYMAKHPKEAESLAVAELTFVRPLAKVLPRLALLGHSLESARAEYEALLSEAASIADAIEENVERQSHLSFEEFCDLSNRFPVAEL